MEFKQENIDKLSLADLIALHKYCDELVEFLESRPSDHSRKQINEYYGPIMCQCTSEIGYRIADLIEPKKLIWQSSTLQQPDVWTDRTNEEYELMNHLARFNWRQIEK